MNFPRRSLLNGEEVASRNGRMRSRRCASHRTSKGQRDREKKSVNFPRRRTWYSERGKSLIKITQGKAHQGVPAIEQVRLRCLYWFGCEDEL